MAQTIVGLFDNSADAETVATNLVDSGFEPQNVSIVTSDERPGIDRAAALRKGGIPEEAANEFALGLERGQTLLVVNAADEQTAQLAGLLSSGGALQVSQSNQVWQNLRTLATPEDDKPGAFVAGDFEIATTAEQILITKQPWVVEEIVIEKAVKQHTETVRETVQYTDVQVERLERDF